MLVCMEGSMIIVDLVVVICDGITGGGPGSVGGMNGLLLFSFSYGCALNIAPSSPKFSPWSEMVIAQARSCLSNRKMWSGDGLSFLLCS